MLKALSSLILLFFHPIVLVPILTLSPFLVPCFDFLNQHTSNLTRTIASNADTLIDFNVIVYALCCTAAFVLFYGLGNVCCRHKVKEKTDDNKLYYPPYYIANRIFRFAALWAIIVGGIGVFAIIYTLGFGNSIEITKLIISGVNIDEWIYGPDSFRFSATVPGMIRMLGFWTIGAYLMWLGVFLASPPWLKKRKAYFVLLCLGLMVVYYFLITQSRFPLVGTAVMTAYVAIYRYSISPRIIRDNLGRSIITLLIMACICSIIVYSISITRASRTQELNPFFDYADLGVANTILSLRSASTWTFGFSTIFGPLNFVFRAFGINLSFVTNAEWIGDPGSCLLAYSYQDFGYFGFVVYGFIGLLTSWIRRKRLHYPDSVLWASVYLWLLVGLTTIWTVPLFRGPDFWAALLGIFIIVYFTNRYQRRLLSGWRNRALLRGESSPAHPA